MTRGRSAPEYIRGSTRPDQYSRALRMTVDVKNYEVSTPEGRRKLIRNVIGQARRRQPHLPPGTWQAVIVDVRGQGVSSEQLEHVRSCIDEETMGLVIADNIRFITDEE